MVYKCRLLYARGLSRREAKREMNGVVDQLAKKLRDFLAACKGSLESKVRGCILQYFNPMVALSAQVYIKPVNKPVEENLCVAKRTAKTKTSASKKNGNEEYELQLALLRSQMTGMQQQVPFIAHRLQTFCQSLALAESALRGKHLDLTFRKVFFHNAHITIISNQPTNQPTSHLLTKMHDQMNICGSLDW